MSLSKSAKYYRENKEARDKKKKYDAKLNSSEKQTRKRVESNRKQREAKSKGINTKGRDWDHATKRFTSVKANRGRRGEGGR